MRLSPGAFTLLLPLIAALIIGAITAQTPVAGRFIVGVLGGFLFFLIAITGRVTALTLIVVWLVFLGLTRRLLIPFAGWADPDPILLVGPAAALLIWMNGKKEAPERAEPLTKIVVLLLLFVLAQTLNFNSGSLVENFLESAFWFGPLLWYFVGRTFPLSAHRKLINLLTILAIPVALHGLYQTYVGLLPFEYAWLGASNFGPAIFFEGFKIRSFSTFTSPQEYGTFLAFVLCMLWATILTKPEGRHWRIALFGLLMWALFLQGGRSIFGFFLLQTVVTTIVGVKRPAIRALVIGAAIGGAFVMTTLSAPELAGSSGAKTAARHQITGLLDPQSGTSTLPLHIALIRKGFEIAWENPLGLGVGPKATHTAGAALGYTSTSTENDISQAWLTFGILPGLLYLALLIGFYLIAGKRFMLKPNWYTLGVIGLLVASTFHIWAGRLYGVSAFLWITLGGLTRPFEEAEVEAEETAEALGNKEAELIR